MSRRKRKVLYVNKINGEIIGSYDGIKEASLKTGVATGTIGTQVLKMGASRDFKCFIYSNNYKKFLDLFKIDLDKQEDKKDIVKRKEKMYYINVLVGLANGTLEDGAVYKLNDSDLVYNKELNRLEIAGQSILTQQQMYEEIEVELPLLLEEERIFFKNILKAFSNVKGIKKCNDIRNGFEFIRIETTTPIENVDLPAFVEGKYYKALEQNRLYTLEELGLK